MNKEAQNQRVQLIDELMSTVQIMDELFRYHPDNPNQVDVVQEFQKLAIRKVEIQSILDAQAWGRRFGCLQIPSYIKGIFKK